MEREFFSIEEEDGVGKVIHYHGFTWERDNSVGERTERGELADYALAEAKWCRKPLAEALAEGDPYQVMGDLFATCQQYQGDMGEAELHELLECFYGDADGNAAPGVRLHMSDLSADTPCGDYFFDLGDRPRFRYIHSREYANQVEDNVSAAMEETLLELMGLMKEQGYAPNAAEWSDEDNAYFAAAENLKEATIAELERLGLSVRSDGRGF